MPIQQFYVMDNKKNLVPAKFMESPDGQGYITDPNKIDVNPVNTKNGHYFDAAVNELANANPNNYLVVPVDFNINSVISFGQFLMGLSSSQQLVSSLRLGKKIGSM